ncbi:MAG: hypothetical protein COB02_16930 [Candidatus Cloacimonadota bacterium]|nr:MAG: hypothetical protein COB02_18400 [Candidatus Cloacimonadota bacterium]PCJ16122.1 MAG: hypothetical protein COB02_16930 [Candidatus Cloacimonadota bacterium]
MKYFICLLFLISINFSENLAQLENMYRRTGNLEALYYLTKGLIAEKNFKKAIRVIKILHKKMPNSPKVLDMEIQIKWAIHQKYEAYKLAYESPDSEFRDKRLSFIKYKNQNFYPFFKLKYEFLSTEKMDEILFEDLLKLFPKNKLLLNLLMDYFIFLEEYEFAYDLNIDFPKTFDKLDSFENLGNKYSGHCKRSLAKDNLNDEVKKSCYFAWKFTPYLMTRFKKIEIKDLIWFFEEKVSHRKTSNFINYYRLSYLYARIKETEKAKTSLSKAIEKSPSYFFDLILERLPYKYMNFKNEIQIQVKKL